MTGPTREGNEGSTSLSTPAAQYNTTFRNMFIEFREDVSVAFFTTYNTSRGPRIFWGEYMKLNYFPMIDIGYNEYFSLQRYESFTWIGPNKLSANTTVTNTRRRSTMKAAFIYEFSYDEVEERSKVKFSIEIISTMPP